MITTESIQEAVSKLMAAKNRPYPQYTNRISQLDHPCERQLFYQRTAWDKASPRSPYFQGILETGTTLEPVIMRNLSEIGEAHDPKFRIVGQQMPTNDKFLKDLEISGSIDGFFQQMVCEGLPSQSGAIDCRWMWKTVSVCDVKTSDPNVFRSLSDFDSLGKYAWTRSYRGQLSLYAIAHNLEWCTLIFVNKSNLWDVKLIHFQVDMEYVERLLKKAERINLAVACNEPPEGINNPDTCPNCPFFSWCAPDFTTGGNLKIVDDTELEAVMDRMGELSEANEEYEDLKKQRDEMLVKGQDVAVGRWLVTWKQASNGVWRKSVVGMEKPNAAPMGTG
jgi:hypothetical protein